jgi:hypothetical protein
MGIGNGDTMKNDANVFAGRFYPWWTGIVPDRFLTGFWLNAF